MFRHYEEDDRPYRDPELVQFYEPDNGWGGDLDYGLGLAAGACTPTSRDIIPVGRLRGDGKGRRA